MSTLLKQAMEISEKVKGRTITGVKCETNTLQLKLDDNSILTVASDIDDERPVLQINFSNNVWY